MLLNSSFACPRRLISAFVSEIDLWMGQWLIARAGVEPSDVDLDRPFTEYGLDSMSSIEMSGEIEDWSGIQLMPADALTHPALSQLSGLIADRVIGAATGHPSTAGQEICST